MGDNENRNSCTLTGNGTSHGMRMVTHMMIGKAVSHTLCVHMIIDLFVHTSGENVYGHQR